VDIPTYQQLSLVDMPTYQQLSLVVVPGGGVEGPAAVAQNESILYLDAGHGKNIKEILAGRATC
jgi:hypothetical protein